MTNVYRFCGNDGVNGWDRLGTYSIGSAITEWLYERAGWIEDGNAIRLPRTQEEHRQAIVAIRKLRATITTDKQKFDIWYQMEKNDMSWLTELPDCPICLPIKNSKFTCPNSTIWTTPSVPTNRNKYHPKASFEIRTLKANAFGAGQQCTYDKKGKLITGGYGAGTADRRQAAIAYIQYPGVVVNYLLDEGHMGEDKSPFDLAYELDKTHGVNVDKYILVRPTNNGNNAPASIK